jgi:hypothetical protein
MKVYGWNELNECAYGVIFVREVEDEGLGIESDEVSLPDSDGRWFITFYAAKHAMIAELQQTKDWVSDAIKKTRALKKKDVCSTE